MSPRWSKKKSSGKQSFGGWLREQLTLAEPPQHDARRLRFEYLEPRQMLSAAQPVGPEFQVNPENGVVASEPHVASDPSGDSVVVWDGGLAGAFAQRYNAAGAAQGSEIAIDPQIPIATGFYPSVAMDEAGDFVVAWVGDASYNVSAIYAQRYNASGVAQGTALLVSGTSSVLGFQAVAMDAEGDFVVTWNSSYDDSLGDGITGVEAQRYNAAGVAQGSNFQIHLQSTTGYDSFPTVAMDAEGDFVVAWQRNSGYLNFPLGVYAQRFNSSGVAIDTPFRVDADATMPGWHPTAAMDAAGDFVIAWAVYDSLHGSYTGETIQAERYNASGAAEGEPFTVNTFTSYEKGAPAVAMDAEGDFVISWCSYYASASDNTTYGIYAQSYNAAGVPQGSEFHINNYTTALDSEPAVAMDATGDFVIAWGRDSNSDNVDHSSVFAQRYEAGPSGSTLTLNGTSSSNVVNITFTDATDFDVTLNGGTPTDYSTATDGTVVYNAPTSGFSELVFSDPSSPFTATQSFNGTSLTSSKFDFTANGVTNLYIYGNGSSTANVNVPMGADSDFFVDDTAAATPYSYIGNPATGDYSELSGFSSETVTGSAATTYAYIYSTSNATTVASPTQTTFTAGSATTTLSNFPQVYVVGAADGTDSVTLDSSGGEFVGTPGFSYATSTSNGASFLLGALYAAHVTGQAAGSSDTAIFYSYAANTFAGASSASSLSGSTANVVGSIVSFVSQASGFDSVSVFESGAGTDMVNLTSPGSGTFLGTSTASTLSFGSSTIAVDTYFVSNGQNVPIPSQIVVTGTSDDMATLYDSPGSNALSASGSTATLTTSLGSVKVNNFATVNAVKQNGSNDTVSEGAIDFALSAPGWTSG